MPKLSAGILLYRSPEAIEVFLVHMGGPYWAKKDEGAWSIPKGEYSEDEDALDAAKREFKEETGFEIEGVFVQLKTLRQKSGKRVSAWAVEGDLDASKVKSNTFEMEWPPKSGKIAEFPEIDRAAWFSIQDAKRKILKGQAGFLDELCDRRGIILRSEAAETEAGPAGGSGQQSLF